MLEAIGLTKKYGDHTALNALNLQVQPGEIYALLGQNGAGKTTTINLFLGFTEPTSGEARVNGLSVKDHPVQTKKHLAYLPETVMLYSSLSGLENLAFFSSLAGFQYKQDELTGFLQRAGLQSEAFTKQAGAYSKGMRQKVGIAIALAKNAKALLLDEPTSGLDPKASNEFSGLLLQLRQNQIAVLMATHDIFRAKEVATRIGIMKEGTLIESIRNENITAKEVEQLYLETI
jgi:ABC-2 type transport system ATP-binding protein